MIILLFTNWFAIFVAVLVYANRREESPSVYCRKSLAAAMLLFCVQSFVFTELLSLLCQLRAMPLALCYLFDTAVLLGLILRKRRELPALVRMGRETVFDRFVVIGLLLVTVVILLPMLCSVFLYPPGTWDAMTYHLPRVEHWMQNANVAHYPTMVTRQLFVQPFPEYLILQFFLFSDNDSWANFVQWLGLAGSLLFVSLLAQLFRLNPRGQFLAVMFALSTPMAVCQATGTQVDLVTSFFLLAICYYGILLIRPIDDDRLKHCVLLGVSLGLGALTKASLALFALPFCLWFAVAYFRCFSRRQWLKYAALVVAVFLVFNGPYFYRNVSLCGHAFGDPDLQNLLRNEPITVSHTLSNIVRTTASQMAVPDESVNRTLYDGAYAIHRAADWDVNDRGATFGETEFSVLFLCCETWVSAFSTLAFFGLGVVIFACRAGWRFSAKHATPRQIAIPLENRRPTGSPHKGKKTRRNQQREIAQTSVQNAVLPPRYANAPFGLTGLYLLCLFGGFVMYCAVLKWNPWTGRLLLPWYMAGAPFVAFVFSTPANDRVKSLLCWCCLGIALSILVMNSAYEQLQFQPGEVWRAETEARQQGGDEFPVSLPDDYRELAPVAISDKHAAGWKDFNRDRHFYYFRARGDVMLGYIVLADALKRGGYHDIGLAFEPMNSPHDRDPWEYPIFRLLKKDGVPHRIEHVHFPEYMKNAPNFDPDFTPQVIVSGLHDVTPLERVYELGEPVPCGLLKLYPVRGLRN